MFQYIFFIGAVATSLQPNDAYNRAILTARLAVINSASNDQRAAATELLADALSRHALITNDADAAAEARKQYSLLLSEDFRIADFSAASTSRARIVNSYGLFLLATGDEDSAGRVFDLLEEHDVLSSRTPSADYARYFYNAAEAARRCGLAEKSFHYYAISMVADPTFDHSCARALSLVDERPDAWQPTDVAAVLDRNGTCGSALLRSAAVSERDDNGRSHAHVITRLLAHLWSGRSPGEPEVAQWKALSANAETGSTSDKRLRQLTDLIERRPYPLISTAGDLQRAASDWLDSDADQRAFSSVALARGHDFALNGEVREAVARYVAAWSVQPRNFDAAAYVAGALMSVQEGDGLYDDVLGELACHVSAASSDGQTLEDPQQLIRLQVALGDVYAMRGRWFGGEGAIYWWENALHASLTPSSDGRGIVVLPELYTRLADAYDANSASSRARAYRLDVTEAYVAEEYWPEAEEALIKALRYGTDTPNAVLRQIERLRLSILLGDLGLEQVRSGVHPRLARRELQRALRYSPAFRSRDLHAAREASAARDVVIVTDVERRLARDGQPAVAVAIKGDVHLFGPFSKEQGSNVVRMTHNIQGVKSVTAHYADIHPRNVKDWLALQSRGKKRAVVGAIVGAALGAVTAQVSGENVIQHALMGAAAGALVGFVATGSSTSQFAPRRQAIHESGYDPMDGHLLRIEDISTTTNANLVQIRIRYLVLGPKPYEAINVKLYRGVTLNSRYMFAIGPTNVVVGGGGGVVESTFTLVMPRNAPSGSYGIEVFVEHSSGAAAGASRSASFMFDSVPPAPVRR